MNRVRSTSHGDARRRTFEMLVRVLKAAVISAVVAAGLVVRSREAMSQTPDPTPTQVVTAAPMVISGPVWVSARPAFTTIRAFVGQTECASAESLLGIDTDVTEFTLLVPSSEEQPGCGTPGATVTFTVGDQPVDTTVSWEAGGSARIALVSGPAFARYYGTFTLARLDGLVEIEPLIAGEVCGEQYSSLRGEGPVYGYAVVVDPEVLKPGCGKPDAAVSFRLVRIDGAGRTPLATANETVAWETGIREVNLTFALAPAALPGTGFGAEAAPVAWLQRAAFVTLCGLLVVATAAFNGRRT